MQSPPVIVVGAGIGGLVAAAELAAQGVPVRVLERAGGPGGKLRTVSVGGESIDAGPTVFTMRWVFDEVFARAGANLADHLTLVPATVLARHAWGPDQRLDLFADIDRSADAIGVFAGAAEARGFRAFCDRARTIYRTLETPFIRAKLPSQLGLVRAAGMREMLAISPFETLWRALGAHFADPRLRQLFGRYATYCGSSPFLAPATLMLVAHVEQDGVWFVEGGMARIAVALAALAAGLGVEFTHGAQVEQIVVAGGRATGVRLAGGETVDASAVVCNADTAALGAGLFGAAASRAVPRTRASERSLSAVTWAMLARARGFPLLRHTVFFGPDYAREFDDMLAGRLPRAPTVYVCAQDRADREAAPDAPERLLILVNAPPVGAALTEAEIARCQTDTMAHVARAGLDIQPMAAQVTGPAGWEALFPGTGGALYGRAVHGSQATFRRPGARSRLPGLYLAGGSTHPGAGVPMAALSGRQAALAVIADRASTRTFHAAGTRGGTSTR